MSLEGLKEHMKHHEQTDMCTSCSPHHKMWGDLFELDLEDHVWIHNLSPRDSKSDHKHGDSK